MKLLPFKTSELVSIGVELEIQIINPHTFSLESRAKELYRVIKRSKQSNIVPEVTQSMIEINSNVHSTPMELLTELYSLQDFLLEQGDRLSISFCGGGTHPFQRWAMQKIFPAARYKKLARIYRYLSKQATVFGLHIHVGCPSADMALYLTHVLSRYVPHLIAITASSPFYQGVDTGYNSSRSTLFNAFPLSGVMPYLATWQEFSDYFYKLQNLNIITSMKDFYWDIRPKPEFGTVEIRVCDTPLTLKRVATLIAYIQALSLYLIERKPLPISRALYDVYSTNRFQAARYGFEGEIIDPYTLQRRSILEDIVTTIKQIEHYANKLNNMPLVTRLLHDVINKQNDTLIIRKIMKQVDSLPKLVEQQCLLWKEK